MADELLRLRADELSEQLAEPSKDSLVVVHSADGNTPAKKMRWTNLKQWVLGVGSILGDMIANGAVTTTKLANDAVTTQKIGYGQVWANNILNGNVTEEKIGNRAVTPNKIADGAVGTLQIANGAVGTLQIANGAVTSAKINDQAVTDDKIADGAVGTLQIANGAVGTLQIANGAVTSAKINDQAVTDDKIADGAVGRSHIEDGCITLEKLHNAVMVGLGRIGIMGAATAAGNVSESTPPDYEVDYEYTHIYDFSGDEPVIMIEQRAEHNVSIKSISFSGIGPGMSRATIVVKGEAGRVIDYRLIIMRIQ